MKKNNNLLVIILAIGVFAILNTEMGIVGILPTISDTFHISTSQTGLLVSLFALAVAISGPVLPMVLSGINRKVIMVLVLSLFLLSNIISIFTSNFMVLLIARVFPAFFHPVYCSLAFSVAADSVSPEEAPKAVSKVIAGISAGMVLGAPISSFLAGIISLKVSMLFFAIATGSALALTIFFVPDLPVEKKLSFGTQLRILKRSKLWLSLIGIICGHAGMFGIFSFYAEYLRSVTGVPLKMISLILFIYGASTIIGNMIAGYFLSRRPVLFIKSFILCFIGFYIVFFFISGLLLPTIAFTVIAGVLIGIGNNVSQYWAITSSPDTPDFTNGLYLSAANLGTMTGITVCGMVISRIGIGYIIFVGISFLILNFVFVYMRTFLPNPVNETVLD